MTTDLTSPGSSPLGVTHRDAAAAPGAGSDAASPQLETPSPHTTSRGPQAGAGAVERGVTWLLLRDGCVALERCTKKAQKLRVGEWFVPGGKIDGGETPVLACLREIGEEWPGVEVLTLSPLPIVDGSGDQSGAFLMRPFVVTVRGDLPPVSGDGMPLRWVPIAEALASPVPQVRMMVAAALATPAPSVPAAPGEAPLASLLADVAAMCRRKDCRQGADAATGECIHARAGNALVRLSLSAPNENAGDETATCEDGPEWCGDCALCDERAQQEAAPAAAGEWLWRGNEPEVLLAACEAQGFGGLCAAVLSRLAPASAPDAGRRAAARDEAFSLVWTVRQYIETRHGCCMHDPCKPHAACDALVDRLADLLLAERSRAALATPSAGGAAEVDRA